MFSLRILARRAAASRWSWFLLLAAASTALALQVRSRVGLQDSQSSLEELLRSTPDRLSRFSIAEMNLLCASDLCATNEPDLKQCNTIIDAWAQNVKSETDRHNYRYARNPAEFESSPGFFRMLMMAVVLSEDYGVRYDPQRMAGPDNTRMDDGFFSNPRSVFLQGLVGPGRTGTCSSLPVLYVAVGRCLGYPLKLVPTKGHLFVRWEGAGERFNIEVTGHGLNRFDDDYYRHWPFELSKEEERAEGYLESLTPAGELAVFLSVRGMCLRQAGRLPEAAESFVAALRLCPNSRSYVEVLASLRASVERGNRQAAALMQDKSNIARN